MNCPNIINNIGLGFDIIGVLILFKYGLPSRINTPPKLLLEGGLTEKENEENKKIWRWAYSGLISLILGFIFQLISNFI
jgi:hypothetical protein